MWFDQTNYGHMLWFDAPSVGHFFADDSGGSWRRGVWQDNLAQAPLPEKDRRDLVQWRRNIVTADLTDEELDRITFAHAELQGHQHWLGAAREGADAADRLPAMLPMVERAYRLPTVRPEVWTLHMESRAA